MDKLSCILSVIIFTLLLGCANQTSPTGGPKDETPPILLNSEPQQGTLHFDGKQVVLTFDELVRTENPKEQFIITPRITDEYEITYRKNMVIIEFKESLTDSTTYSINFREGIKDITEGNPADTLRLAFSTGNFLDSLSINGSVSNLLTNRRLEDITIGLYKANDTTDLLNSPPFYLTKTDEEGKYSIRNVKNGKYRIYAFNDKNKNMMLESKSEPYGFISDTLILDSNVSNLNIPIQVLDIRDLALQSVRQSGTTYAVKYNKFITDYNVISHDPMFNIYSNFTDQTQNTIHVFEPENLQDSTEVTITATDSVNSFVRDTVMIKFEETQRSPGEFTVQTTLDKIVIDKPIFKAHLKFTKPIAKINYDSLFLYLDSANIISFTIEDLKWSKHYDELTLTAEIDPALFVEETKADPDPDTQPPNEIVEVKEDEQLPQRPDTIPDEEKIPPPKPHFYSGPYTFISAELDSSQKIMQALQFVRPEQLARIIVEVNTDEENYFVQLLNSRNEVADEVAKGKKFEFINVDPGEYRIRVLVDLNNNGSWDPGNIILRTEPEPVYFYSGSDGNEIIAPKPNWHLGPNIINF